MSWGKTLGDYAGHVSPLFCPPLGATVLERNTTKVYNLALYYINRLIAITVDGFLLRGDVELSPELVGSKIGQFRVEANGWAKSLQDAYRVIEGKDHGNWKEKEFGIAQKRFEGIFDSKEVKVNIPYGSFGRQCEKNDITLSDLEGGRIFENKPYDAKTMNDVLDQDIQLTKSINRATAAMWRFIKED
jgi:hypothetical protein